MSHLACKHSPAADDDCDFALEREQVVNHRFSISLSLRTRRR
jgi:hypothetical protein